jgi:flavin-dependent dehydrogenase
MNLPLFERLGVLDKVRALGVYKRGADFEADNERGYNTFAFERALGNSPPHAYQVLRQDFDKMLFDHARATGADAREGHEVVAVEPVDARRSHVEVRVGDASTYRTRTSTCRRRQHVSDHGPVHRRCDGARHVSVVEKTLAS